MTERPPDTRPLGPRWTWLFLAGPTIWYLYFWVAYLAAEAGCAADAGAVVTWVTIGLSGGTMVALAYHTSRARRTRHQHVSSSGSLMRAGFLMGAFFVLVTLFVGFPAVVLQPC